MLDKAGARYVKIMAGGQSLIPVMRLRLAAPSTVVDLGRVHHQQPIGHGLERGLMERQGPSVLLGCEALVFLGFSALGLRISLFDFFWPLAMPCLPDA